MTPQDILKTFQEKWGGTEEELEAALEEFYNDIRGSVELALTAGLREQRAREVPLNSHVLDALDDYVGNYYF